MSDAIGDAMSPPRFTEDETRYLAECRAFANDVLAPLHRAADDANDFPREIHTRARAAGLLDAGFPRALGGRGVSMRALAHGGRALARVCAPAAFTMGFNHGALRPVLFAGTDAQKRALVTDTLARGGYAAWCMTEKDVSGSNLMAIRTRADRAAGGWIVRGEKCMTGNGTVADLFFVLADAWDGARRLGPTVFAVRRGPGVTVGANTDKLGFRCLTTPDVSFQDVRVADDSVIGGVGEGFAVIVDSLDFMRFGGGIVILGLVEGALFDVLPWLEEREVYGGTRLVDDTHAQVTLGKLVAETDALAVLLEKVATLLDDVASGTPAVHSTPPPDARRRSELGRLAGALKLLGSDLALRTTATAQQLHGWRGVDARFSTEKRFRDARQTAIYEGTSEILAMNTFRSFLRDHRARADAAASDRGDGERT